MEVYNYFRTQWADEDTPLDDAPASVTRAIERWLGRQPPGPGVGIRVGQLEDPALTLLALHVAGSLPGGELVHVVAVPGAGLQGDAAQPVTALFAALYGGRPELEGPKLQEELSRLRHRDGAPRALRHFALPEHVEALPWSAPVEPQGPSRARRALAAAGWLVTPRLFAAAGVGVVSLVLGFALVPAIFSLLDAAKALREDSALRDRIAALESRVESLSRELHDEAADRQLALARIERRYEPQRIALRAEPLPPLDVVGDPLTELPLLDRVEEPLGELPPLDRVEESLADLPPPAGVKAVLAETVAVAPEPAPPPSPVPAEPAPPQPTEPDPLPSVAAAPPGPPHSAFRVAARTARVRAGPSSQAATRGLLANGAQVFGRAGEGEWIELAASPDFAPPSWIHASVLVPSGPGAP